MSKRSRLLLNLCRNQNESGEEAQGTAQKPAAKPPSKCLKSDAKCRQWLKNLNQSNDSSSKKKRVLEGPEDVKKRLVFGPEKIPTADEVRISTRPIHIGPAIGCVEAAIKLLITSSPNGIHESNGHPEIMTNKMLITPSPTDTGPHLLLGKENRNASGVTPSSVIKYPLAPKRKKLQFCVGSDEKELLSSTSLLRSMSQTNTAPTSTGNDHGFQQHQEALSLHSSPRSASPIDLNILSRLESASDFEKDFQILETSPEESLTYARVSVLQRNPAFPTACSSEEKETMLHSLSECASFPSVGSLSNREVHIFPHQGLGIPFVDDGVLMPIECELQVESDGDTDYLQEFYVLSNDLNDEEFQHITSGPASPITTQAVSPIQPAPSPAQHIVAPIQPHGILVQEIVIPIQPPGTPIRPQRKRTRTPANDDESPKRKKQCQKWKWKTTVAKAAQNSGQAHVSLRGVVKPARVMGPGCNESCRRKCQTRISERHRQILFDRFWALEDHERQWDALLRYITVTEVKQRTTPVVMRNTPLRNSSRFYHLINPETNEVIPKVCLTMFLHTFDIDVAWVRTALKKNVKPDGQKASPKDNRGSKTGMTRAGIFMRQNVKAHIEKFPRVESHYCRARSRRKYLDENLSIAKMHRMYVAERGDQPYTANEALYRKVFRTQFNLGFFKPKKDQCSLCLQYKQTLIKSPALQKQYDKHIEDKENMKAVKENDISTVLAQEEKNVRVITFDLQKVLYCPKGEDGAFFFRRKFSVYNFTIHDSTTGKSYCYVWDQTVAHKGSNEVNSCLMDYIDAAVKEGVKEIHAYSDNCPGQNKNKFLFSMYHMLSQKHGIKIIHRWLVKGHTHMECDSIHARIETKTKKIPIHTPAQWYGYIRSAKVNPPFYTVKELDRNSVFCFKGLANHHKWTSVPSKTISEMIVDPAAPGVVTYSINYDGPQKTVSVLPPQRGRRINLANFQLKPALSERIPLRTALLKDLQWYVKKGHIPEASCRFYESLPNWRAPTAEADEDSDGYNASVDGEEPDGSVEESDEEVEEIETDVEGSDEEN